MIFGVNPTKDAVVIALATGSGQTFVIKSIRSLRFQARSGDGLNELLQRLVVIFDLSGRAEARQSHCSDRRRVGSSLPSKQ